MAMPKLNNGSLMLSGRRRVSIEVRGHPEYKVWGRKSYYAPGPDQ